MRARLPVKGIYLIHPRNPQMVYYILYLQKAFQKLQTIRMRQASTGGYGGVIGIGIQRKDGENPTC